MKVVTYNVAALDPFLREMTALYGGLDKWLLLQKIDIFCVQEAKIFEVQAKHGKAGGAHYESFWSVSTVKKGYSGVTTFVHERYSPIAVEISPLNEKKFDEEGRCLLTDHGAFVVVNVYVPNAGGEGRPRLEYKMDFLSKLYTKLKILRDQGRSIILCSDINISPSSLDVYKALKHVPLHGYSIDELNWMSKTFASSSLLATSPTPPLLIDVWRLKHPTTDDVFSVFDNYTRAHERNEGTRIDIIAIDYDMMKRYGGGVGSTEEEEVEGDGGGGGGGGQVEEGV